MRVCNYSILIVTVFFFQNSVTFEIATKCEPPPNINELPVFAQEEILEIWKTYVPGTPCLRQKEIESDIFDVVKSFETESNNEFKSKQTKTDSSDLDYEQISSNDGTPIPLSVTSTASSIARRQKQSLLDRNDEEDTDDYLDKTTFDDVAMMQFDNVNAPFLRTASHDVKSQFEKIWNDPDIPSEGLRALKIQTLAVSLLTSNQLTEYNRWATKRRRVLKAREQEMRGLSFGAKQTLRKMSNLKAREPEEQIVVPAAVKSELTTFVQKLNRRRNLRLVI